MLVSSWSGVFSPLLLSRSVVPGGRESALWAGAPVAGTLPARRRRGKVFFSPEWQRPPHWEGVFPTACTQGAGALPCRGFAPAGGLRFRGPSDSGYLVHVWALNTHKHGHTYSHIYTNPHTHMHLHVLTHVLPKIYTQRPPHTHTRTCSTLGS